MKENIVKNKLLPKRIKKIIIDSKIILDKETETIKKIRDLYYSKKKDKIEETWPLEDFVPWYIKEIKKNECHYCHTDQDKISECINQGILDSKRFGKRGKNLELERKNTSKNNNIYTRDNCELICYFCNNAKSDIFNENEFKTIAEEIGKVLAEKIERL
jgi:hypothetical protein